MLRACSHVQRVSVSVHLEGVAAHRESDGKGSMAIAGQRPLRRDVVLKVATVAGFAMTTNPALAAMLDGSGARSVSCTLRTLQVVQQVRVAARDGRVSWAHGRPPRENGARYEFLLS